MKDLVLQEVWKAKDELAAECDYNIDTLFRKLEGKQTGRKIGYRSPRKTRSSRGKTGSEMK